MKIWQRALYFAGLPIAVVTAAVLHQPPPPEAAPYHLTKRDAAGQVIAPWSGPWSCVCDNSSGLLWEVKTDDEGIHDGLWTYSWYLANPPGFHTAARTERAEPLPEVGVPDNGDCYFEETRCDTEDLIRRTNQQKLCGENNWRLPTAAELATLVYPQAKAGQAKIDTDYFPHTKRGDYWTGDEGEALPDVYRYLHRGAEAISFVDGEQFTIPHRNAAFVRLVSADSNSCH
ncbi:DUF1566 domain-containing protein [Microbulbifer pacificus]|uniref:Lcl C-terminal domain-containing protein n=1 Tax=Microbulbifer pacificus TaxID=407164 RepID=UPI000CF3C89B|nr:DUF1566 domain-containing protein [Microbulbifer pacificus]